MITEKESRWFRKRAWAEINLDHLAHNYREIRKSLDPSTQFMAVVKSNAYGQGLEVVGPELEKLGIDWFGVAELEEGLALRRLGIARPILILSPVPAAYAEIVGNNNLTVTIVSYADAKAYQAYAEEANVTIDIHIKLDTGMNRLGFPSFYSGWEPHREQIESIYNTMDRLNVTGTYTHFASADEVEKEKREFQELQYKRFRLCLRDLESRGYDLGIVHCSNSGATLNDKDYQFDMVRGGTILYGEVPGDRNNGDLELRPTMSLSTRIHQVKTIPEDCKISYGLQYTTKGTTQVATVAIGYADGYPRSLSNKSYLIYKGHKAPVIGNICMDQLMIDLTGIPDVENGDVVTVVGTSGEETLRWGDLAELLGTIHYELICGVGDRIPRIYTKGGKDIAILSYQNFVPAEIGLCL